MQTECIYCGSNSYGKKCMFSPTDTHVHMNNSDKCIYCASESRVGKCMFNPYGQNHVKGAEFLNKSALKTEKATILTYILNTVSILLSENTLYKSPLDRLYKRIASIIASVSEPLLEAFCLQETPTYKNLSKKQLIECIEYKKKFTKELEVFTDVINEASLKLPPEIVENVLMDAILNIDVRKNKN